MNHPIDIPGFKTALGALTTNDLPTVEPVIPPAPTDEMDEEAQAAAALAAEAAVAAAEAATEAVAAMIEEAQHTGSVVPQCGLVLDALYPHVASLSLPAAKVLAGAAHLVLLHNYMSRASEADTARDAARVRIQMLEA